MADVPDDAPLSMSEAVAAYTATPTAEEVQQDQSEEVTDEQESPDADDELLTTDPVGEEDEGDTDPDTEDQAEDDEAGESDDEIESDQGRFVSDNAKVRLADGTVTTIADLKAGSLKNADYTQKTQAVAEKERTLTVQSERVKQQEQQVTEQAAYVADLIRSIVPTAPDPELLKTDPMGYFQAEASFKQWTAHLEYLDQQKQKTAEAAQAEATEKAQQRAKAEWDALVSKVPALKDEKRAASWFGDIEAYATAEGYTIDELKGVIARDHRQMVTLRKAALWDKLQANKAKAKTPTGEVRPPVQKGGKRDNPGAGKARVASAAMERLNQTGSVRDGVAALLATQSKG